MGSGLLRGRAIARSGRRGERRVRMALWLFVALLSSHGLAEANENRGIGSSDPGIATAPAAATKAGVVQVPAVLRPREYGMWSGEWLLSGSDTAENVYTILRISDVHPGGFSYKTECRDVPYGPNATWSGEERAEFLGPLDASNAGTRTRFRLRVNAHDRHDRYLRMTPLQCSHTDAPGEAFVFRRSVFRAGFDCARAATPVERAVCGNELLARGDLEMGALYRSLLAALRDGRAEQLRAGQRAWLRERNACGTGDAVDVVCIARQYAGRLAALSRLADPALGQGTRFDAAYVTALLSRGAELREETIVRLAMFPLVMKTAGAMSWRADADGILLEQTSTRERVLFPGSIEFRYSGMLFVGADGAIMAAEHTESLAPPELLKQHHPNRVWTAAGRAPFRMLSSTGIELSVAPITREHLPHLVRSWLNRHPASETIRTP